MARRIVVTFTAPDEFDENDLATGLDCAVRQLRLSDPTVWPWEDFWADVRDGVVDELHDGTAADPDAHQAEPAGTKGRFCRHCWTDIAWIAVGDKPRWVHATELAEASG